MRSALSPKDRLRHLVVGAVMLGVVAAAGGCTKSSPKPVPAPDTTNASRVLQQVAVTMRPDATATAVTANNIFVLPATKDDPAPTVSSTLRLAPNKVINELPVRVLTSWIAGERSGTDLAELAGHSGPVEIDITVQNLTGTTQDVVYNVAGASRTQPAQVAVPLTVVASATLDGLDPSRVVVASPTQADRAATNGVVSASPDGGSVVQWAALLAPPQLAASATLRLVVDAEKLRVPNVDLSVEPGVHTDASAANFVSGALTGTGSTEADMLARTVQLIADVNGVLAKAGTTITEVATKLDSTGETLGTKTVSDLTASTVSLVEAMEALSGQATDLGSNLSSSLKSTQSSLVSTLRDTVNAANSALGDTSQISVPPQVSGSDCAAKVRPAQRQPSLYGTLLEVAGQLQAYAQVDQACKAEIQQALTVLVGPATPDAESCAKATSLSCTLLATQTAFLSIADSLERDGQEALAAADPNLARNVQLGYEALSAKIDAAARALEVVRASTTIADQTAAIEGVRAAITAAKSDSQLLNQAVLGLHQQAQAALQQNAAVEQTGRQLVAQLCGLISDGTLTSGRGQALLSYLTDAPAVSLPGCTGPASQEDPGLAPEETPEPPASYDVIGNTGAALKTDIEGQNAVLTSILDTTAPSAADAQVATVLSGLTNSIAGLDQLVGDDGELTTTNRQNLATRDALNSSVAALTSAVAVLVEARDGLDPKMTALAKQQGVLSTAITTALGGASDSARTEAGHVTGAHQDQLHSQLTGGLGILDAKFGLSTRSLTQAATTITTDGAAVIAAQKEAITTATAKAGLSISDQVSANLDEIGASVSASTKNLAATSTLLSADLRTVLLDLGSQRERTGMLGAITTSSAIANAANGQLATASQTADAYANARGQDIAGVQLRAAQTQAALQAQAAFPLFHLDLPDTVEHRTVYSFHLGASK